MGTAITKLLERKELNYKDLKNKILVVDSYNILYQFLTTIRQRDGSLLTDSNGNVTSHLVGLFSRTTNLMKKGIKLAFVFDGKAPYLKKQERERRKELKLEAQRQYEIAKKRENIYQMKKYASRTTRLTTEMVKEAKKLIGFLGLPIIQAPSEGEAQAAYIVKQGDAYASISQDMDSLVFATPRLIRNLTISGKKKVKGKPTYTSIKPEIINLEENLNKLGISQEQLIVLSILIGTDYNNGGIKGIGPKRAIKLVKKFNNNFDKLFKEVKWEESFNISWKKIYNTIKEIPIKKDYELKWQSPNNEKIYDLLVKEHGFSESHINKTIEEINKKNQQKSLGAWF